MVDTNIKLVSVLNADLPYIQFNDTELFYDLRYRVVSEDKNRSSHWSQIYKIIMPTTTDANLPYTTSDRISIKDIGNSPKTIQAYWNFPQESERDPDPDIAQLEKIFSEVSVFDIWIRWQPNNGDPWEDWQYIANISANSFSLLHRADNPFAVEIAVQIPTVTKVIDSRLTLFQASLDNL